METKQSKQQLRKSERRMIVMDAHGNVRFSHTSTSACSAGKSRIVQRVYLLAKASHQEHVPDIVTSIAKRGKAMKQIIYDENFHRRVLPSGKEVPQRSSLKPVQKACPTKPTAPGKPRRRLHIMPLLIGLVVMFVLLFTLCRVVQPAAASALAQWQAGEDRLSAFRLDVGHGKQPSEFMTQYKDGQAIVIEFPGGDFEGARIYLVPVSEHDTAHRIVSLQAASFPVGKPHLFVQVEGFSPYVLYNTGETFSHTLPVPKEEKKP